MMPATSPTTGRTAEAEILQALMALLRQFSAADLRAACEEHFARREAFAREFGTDPRLTSDRARQMGRAHDCFARGVLRACDELGDLGPIKPGETF